MRSKIYIVQVKPVRNQQQCLSILSIHRSQVMAEQSLDRYLIKNANGYGQIESFEIMDAKNG